MSTSVDVSFLSRIFVSRANLANFALSISGAASLAPKVQYDLKSASILQIVFLHENSRAQWSLACFPPSWCTNIFCLVFNLPHPVFGGTTPREIQNLRTRLRSFAAACLVERSALQNHRMQESIFTFAKFFLTKAG